jgi:hypothetical protein
LSRKGEAGRKQAKQQGEESSTQHYVSLSSDLFRLPKFTGIC